jgi:hypothetical protein
MMNAGKMSWNPKNRLVDIYPVRARRPNRKSKPIIYLLPHITNTPYPSSGHIVLDFRLIT